ncbi:HDOD domain-containing protein [Thermodesulfobacteriota bacterium]
MKSQPDLRRNPVPSGSYVISEKKGEVLDSYLGTCVGVTLCDQRAGVGGLIHILLPEPIGQSMIGRPQNYAVIGLPMFIKELYDKGAKKEELVAVVAGGALVGPLTEMDLNLDIGGRTNEIVEKILHDEGIPIHKSETGGYFSCRLSLNLNTWKSYIEPINSPAISATEDFEKPDAQEIDRKMESVSPIPQIALKVIRMIQDDTFGMQDMAKEIRQDQIISAKIIRLCNSAFFHQKDKVDSINRALIMLGEKQLLRMVVSASIEDLFSNDTRGYSLCKGGLFNHAVGTAMISEKIADFSGRVSGDIAYTAGLLHDIGKVALDQYVDLAYPLFYRRTQVDGETLITVEGEVFGLNHAEVGGRLAEKWSLPEHLIEAIRYHHNPEKASLDVELTHIVYLADLLMSRFIVGQELERVNTDFLAARLAVIGLSPEQFPALVDRIPGELYNLYLPSVK